MSTSSPTPSRLVLLVRALVHVVAIPCALILTAYWITIWLALSSFLIIALSSFSEAGWGLGLTYRLVGAPFPTWRIDYIFHTPQLAALAAFPGYFNGSDHRPVIADLGFKP